MSLGHVLMGAMIGVGAVAAAPFTGGGSILGAATLAGSLSGIGTGVAAATAGFVGAAVADAMADDMRFEGYDEGYKDGQIELSEKMIESHYGPMI